MLATCAVHHVLDLITTLTLVALPTSTHDVTTENNIDTFTAVRVSNIIIIIRSRLLSCLHRQIKPIIPTGKQEKKTKQIMLKANSTVNKKLQESDKIR